MLSRFAHVKSRDGVCAIFHELHPDPVFCTSEEWASVVAGDYYSCMLVDLIRDLRSKKIIIESEDEDEDDYLLSKCMLEKKLNQTTILYLMTAQGCNMRCSYCPIPKIAEELGDNHLTFDDARAGIDLWLDHVRDTYKDTLDYYVIFYGGEPLLNKQVIKKSLDYLAQKRTEGVLPKKCHVMIATNGILVDEEFVSLCVQYSIMVAVGLDGPKAINDALKIDLHDQGTYERITRSISMLVKAGVRTFVSASITPANLGEIPSLGAFFESLGVKKFGLNFLKGRLSKHIAGPNIGEYYHKATRAVIAQSKVWGKGTNEYQMEKKLHAFYVQDFFPVDCTCYGNQLVIQPDGQVSHCPFSRPRFGKISEIDGKFRIWDTDVVRSWRTRLPLYHSGFAKALSGGGCAWSVGELTGDPTGIDESSVIFSEEVLDELIWAEYERRSSQT